MLATDGEALVAIGAAALAALRQGCGGAHGHTWPINVVLESLDLLFEVFGADGEPVVAAIKRLRLAEQLAAQGPALAQRLNRLLQLAQRRSEPVDNWNQGAAEGVPVPPEALERCAAASENYEPFVGYLSEL
eukprot:SAG31_NODE_5076_length_2760_cov_1.299511_3_plen_132_part_00